MLQLPTYDDVAAAARRLQGQAHLTPVLRSATADRLLKADVFFKCENLQRMGAFKFRGAYNALAKFSPAQRNAGVIAFSSGNHAQAIALAARLLGIPATIVMPLDAPQAKVDATRGYGGEVITYDRYTQDREALTAQIAGERGLTLIPPYDHPDVIAGQGSAAKELFEQVGELDVLLVPLWAAVACSAGRHSRRGRCRRAASSTGSSPKPGTTRSSRCARARSSISPRPIRSPTVRRRSILAASRSK